MITTLAQAKAEKKQALQGQLNEMEVQNDQISKRHELRSAFNVPSVNLLHWAWKFCRLPRWDQSHSFDFSYVGEPTAKSAQA